MATKSQQQQDQDQGDSSSTGIERVTKLHVHGMRLETSSGGETRLQVSSPIDATLTDDDITNLGSFFNTLIREQRRNESQGGSGDGRGQVLSPSDGRLAENRNR